MPATGTDMAKKRKNNLISVVGLKRLTLLGLIGIFGNCSVALAAGNADLALAKEISRLSRSIEHLEATLESQKKRMEDQVMLQKLNAAIAYLNFRSRRIESLEKDLQGARNVKLRLEDMLEQLAQQDELLENEAKSSLNPNGSDKKQSRKSIERQRTLLKQRLARVDGEIVEMETRLYDLQKQVEGVESFVEKNLKL